MNAPARRRCVATTIAFLFLVAAGTTPAFADPMDPGPGPGPDPNDVPLIDPVPFDPGILVDDPGPPLDLQPMFEAPDIQPWSIYRRVLVNPEGEAFEEFSLAQWHPGPYAGWEWFEGSFPTFAAGGAVMNALGVPGWEDFV